MLRFRFVSPGVVVQSSDQLNLDGFSVVLRDRNRCGLTLIGDNPRRGHNLRFTRCVRHRNLAADFDLRRRCFNVAFPVLLALRIGGKN